MPAALYALKRRSTTGIKKSPSPKKVQEAEMYAAVVSSACKIKIINDA
jgi:hypothetical protein